MIRFAATILILLPLIAGAQTPGYKRLTKDCRACNQIEDLIVKHDKELVPDDRQAIAFQMGDVIKTISIKGKKEEEQRRLVYFAINGTIQVIDDDFDSVTCLRLLDIRTSSPKNFDYVFHRFPLVHQNNIIGRMNAYKEDNFRPKAEIPTAKLIED